jgi:class 3 adenylate cyclase
VEQRAAKLREALGLWRGPPLGELAFEPFAALEVARLEELRLAAAEDLIDAELELGRDADLVPELEALISEHPFDERLRGQLMLALYRAGRQSEALEAYQVARRTLDEELGLEPGPPLRELEQAILRHDPSLDAAAAEPLLASRRTVTVVFAAVEGGDPELVGAGLEHLRHAAARHGGRASFAGDASMAVFGATQVHEDDALRAVRAAAELRAVLPEARVGVATGPVYAAGEVIAGAPVTLARQLQQVAPAGETLVSADTLHLVRDAVEVRRATWVNADAFRLDGVVEGAPGLARSFSTPLVGRLRELGALRAAFADARERRACSVFTVVGDAGIGKTRLARQLAGEVRNAATVLVGRCPSYGEGATYLPLVEMLGSDFLDAGSTGEIFLEARRRLEERAMERPLLLLFEDIHWAEPTLLDFLEYLGEHATGSPILALCLARPDLLLERPGWCASLELGPLTDAEALGLAGNAVDADRIVEIAEGNPLYVQQLAAYVTEQGSAALETVPPSIEALIASRLDLLGPAERALLQRAAVVGRRFSFGAVAALGPTDALPRLEQDGFVHQARDMRRFHHVLVRDVAYSGIPKAERAELHRQHADWLDGQPEGTDELVGYHLERAAGYLRDLAAPEQQIERVSANSGVRLGAAGIQSWKRGDATTTIALLTRATALLPELDPHRLELCCELGEAQMVAGEYAGAATTLADTRDQAREAGCRNVELRARLSWLQVALHSEPIGAGDDLLDEATKAIPVLDGYGDDRALGRAWYYVSSIHGAYHNRYAEAEEAARVALEHYERAGWPVAACISSIAAAALNGPTPVSNALDECAELLASADMLGTAYVLPASAGLLAMQGRFDEAREQIKEARAVFDALGQRSGGELSCGERDAEIEVLAGDDERARSFLEESCAKLEQMGSRAHLATRRASLATVCARQGDLATGERLAREALAASSPDDLVTIWPAQTVVARALARRGALAEGESLARRTVDLMASTDALTSRTATVLGLAEVLSLAGKDAEAAEAFDTALDFLRSKQNEAGLARALEGDILCR